jgi:hypothetical protein
MFTINSIFWIDGSTDIGVIESHNVHSENFDIITFPSTWTFTTWLPFRGFTRNVWISDWTMHFSPFIFNNDNTVIEFTSFDLIVSIGITVSEEEVNMIIVKTILSIDLHISISI